MKQLTRRRALKTLFCSSAAMALNLKPRSALAEAPRGGLNFLAIGDFGSGAQDQKNVAQAMQDYAAKNALKPDALFSSAITSTVQRIPCRRSKARPSKVRPPSSRRNPSAGEQISKKCTPRVPFLALNTPC